MLLPRCFPVDFREGVPCTQAAAAANELGLSFVAFNNSDALAAAFHPKTLIVRTCALFDSACDEGYLADFARVSLDLLIDGERGVWHLTNPNGFGWFDTAALPSDVKDGPAPGRVAVTG